MRSRGDDNPAHFSNNKRGDEEVATHRFVGRSWTDVAPIFAETLSKRRKKADLKKRVAPGMVEREVRFSATAMAAVLMGRFVAPLHQEKKVGFSQAPMIFRDSRFSWKVGYFAIATSTNLRNRYLRREGWSS